MIEIKNRLTGEIIISGKYDSIKEALEENKGADLEGADLRGADLEGADLRGADLEGADLGGAYLEGADLRGADLEGADLGGAYLRRADLEGADLRGANLRGAYLGGADLGGAYVSIQGTRHIFNYYDGYIWIGCEFYSLEYWLIMYDTIGRENNYSEKQIKEYYTYIKMCKEL